MSLPVVELSYGVAVLVDCVVWAAASTAVGLTANRLADERFAEDGWLLRIRPWERDGRVYADRLRIKAWKGHLPEAGHWFAGGFDKKHLGRGERGHLEQFVVETRRAEWTHWVLLLVSPLFLLWNPWWLGLVMIAYAIVANGPCILIQRYNRCRLRRVLARAERRPAPGRAPDLPRRVGENREVGPV
jgi:glycosyl-4,4'-diaponeurosporenoate acyltransferase